MNRIFVLLVAAASVVATSGCATKNYVRKEVTPVIDKTNELDDLTARNHRDIRDVDTRAQQGIQSVNTKSDQANQKALAAGKTADEAQSLSNQALTGVNSLTNAVANLDNYRPVADTSVHFAFDKADLTPKAKKALDELSAEVPNTKHYILEITGGTDSVGDAAYNYDLSQRRAAAVIQYLAQAHDIPAHKIYLIGLGKDKPVASNGTGTGRAKNRRVDVRLMTNLVEGSTEAQNTAPAPTK